MPDIIKYRWSGGMNQFDDPANIDFATEYYLGVNVRIRGGVVSPVAGPLNITSDLPADGAVQGMYGVGNFLVVFIAGSAYYKDYTAAVPVWNPVIGFSPNMTKTGRIYACAIPTSTVNYIRTSNNAVNYKQGVSLSGTRNSSPTGFVIMDGFSLPYIIFSNGTSRQINSFGMWTKDNPEYVPVGILPFYHDGILYCIGADLNGNFNQIYRSVSGRPLDFMVAVDINGNKISNLEAESGAPAVAYRVDYDDVTYIGAITTVDQGFLICTAKNSYIVLPDYVNTIFSEPTYSNQFLFSVGAVNSNSVTDVSGDTTVIHYRGIRTFNGVATAKFEGKNAPFNLKINALLDGFVQSSVACTTYDNYAVYAVQTKYGYGLLWYDTLFSQWVSIDLYPATSAIVMFATVVVGLVNKLFYYTADNQLFECFAGGNLSPAVYLGEIVPTAYDTAQRSMVARGQHAISNIYAMFADGTTQGVAEIAIYGDRVRQAVNNQVIAGTVTAPVGLYQSDPYMPAATNNTQRPIFDFQSISSFCTRAGILISWSNNSKLMGLKVTTEQNNEVAIITTLPAGTATTVTSRTLIFVGNDGVLNANRSALNAMIKSENADAVFGLGNHTVSPGNLASIATYLAPYWDYNLDNGTFHATAGPNEVDATSGEPFYGYVRQGANRRTTYRLGPVDVYLLNDGFNGSGAQTDPLNQTGADYQHSQSCQWLAGEIAASTARMQVVCFHTSPRTSANEFTPGNAILDGVNWSALGVNVLVTSSARSLERLHGADGLVYLNSGGGGQSLSSGFASPLAGSAYRGLVYGYLRATVSSLSALWEFVGADGTVLDSYITRPA